MEEKGKGLSEATWGTLKKLFPHPPVAEVSIYLHNIHSYAALPHNLLEKEKVKEGCSLFSF